MGSIRQLIVFISGMLLISVACQKSVVESDANDVLLDIPSEIRTVPLIAPLAVQSDTVSSISKAKVRNADLARVMVVDLSAYRDSEALSVSDQYGDYLTALETWRGDFSFWSDYEKVIGDHFTIVTNQTLDIVGDYVEGTVPGVVGLNRVVIAIIRNFRIAAWGEGDVTGVAGESAAVDDNNFPGLYWTQYITE